MRRGSWIGSKRRGSARGKEKEEQEREQENGELEWE